MNTGAAHGCTDSPGYQCDIGQNDCNMDDCDTGWAYCTSNNQCDPGRHCDTTGSRECVDSWCKGSSGFYCRENSQCASFGAGSTCDDQGCCAPAPLDCCSTGGGNCSCPNDGYHFSPNFCEFPATGCPSEATFEAGTGCCANSSPVLLDLTGAGITLTDAAHGVNFDLNGDGRAGRIAWIAAQTQNGWLVLDRNGNGLIDDGREMFGTLTPQPLSEAPNGFVALAEYDRPEHGGNGNGQIDDGDAVFPQLRVWVDANHNGVSESRELLSLHNIGIVHLDLRYQEGKKSDEFGNVFRYRARVLMLGVPGLRWAYDVFLVSGE